ncbi:YgfZ/GcvT domain-containing protein [Roseibium sediminis]|uniref:CAF17-like 4Fe-4S cluster assembly/insertion protein YgfZ n=1 Tax=Roseibium sediminis TaxID=1775174 RepID=UPI00123D85A1|nr:folate-binding protein YgfZ [Roseibium sediminis]
MGLSKYASLTDRSVIRLSGADVHHFLQNLVTSNIDKVDESGAGFAALLTPQGKILFDFLIIKDGADYLLDTPSATAADLVKRLTFYRLRAKLDITDISATHQVIAAWGGEAPVAATQTRAADPRLAALGSRFYGNADEISSALEASGFAAADMDAYRAYRVTQGVPESLSDFDYSSIFPHDADMDQLNGVSFSKGCYVGQEVVSRVHHRGTARKRFIQVSGSAPLPSPGADLEIDGASIGTLASTVDAGDRFQGIALVRLDKVARGRAEGHQVTCNGAIVELTIPDWATFDWPASSDDDA